MCRIQQTIFTAYILSNFYLILSKQNQKFTINILISLIFFNIIIVFEPTCIIMYLTMVTLLS